MKNQGCIDYICWACRDSAYLQALGCQSPVTLPRVGRMGRGGFAFGSFRLKDLGFERV